MAVAPGAVAPYRPIGAEVERHMQDEGVGYGEGLWNFFSIFAINRRVKVPPPSWVLFFAVD